MANLHIDQAKRELLEFHEKHKSKTNALFLVSGKNEENVLEIKIVPSDVLEHAKKQYSDLTACHIYSLESNELELNPAEIISGTRLKLEPEFDVSKLESWGVLVNEELGTVEDTKVEEAPRKPKEVKPVVKATQTKEPPKVLSKKEQKPSLLSGYVSRKLEKSNPLVSALSKKRLTGKAAEAPKKTYTYTSRKEKKDKVVISDNQDIGDVDELLKQRKLEEEKQKKELEAMFDDTFEEAESMNSPEKKQTEPKTQENSPEKPQKLPVKEELPVKKELPEKPSVITYVDDDGYTVTKRVGASEEKPRKKKKVHNTLNFFLK